MSEILIGAIIGACFTAVLAVLVCVEIVAFARRQFSDAVTATVNNLLRAIMRDYETWAQANEGLYKQLRQCEHTANDHNHALIAIVGYLEKQGFEVNPRPKP